MKIPGRRNLIMPRAAMVAITCAGIITATVATAQGYEEAMEESSQERPDQGEPSGDVLEKAMQESERERPDQPDESGDVLEKAMEESRRERP